VPRLERWAVDRRARTHALLELVDLPRHPSCPPFGASGGQRQRQRGQGARDRSADPLMDEPFGALDPVRGSNSSANPSHSTPVGTSVILVTHDMSEAFALAGRIGVLDAGGLVICETPQQVAASRDPRVRVLLDTMSRPPESSTS
jgi:osmoprotectant transport system ATP-binding protein